MTRAPDLLISYLADRDIHCEGCRYNLRGVTTVQCPECGLVIPRPPAEFIQRAATDPATLRLYCEDCGYAVTGVNVDRCPECSSRRLARYSGETPPRISRWKRLPPLLVIILSGASVIVLVTCISAAYARAWGARGRGDPWIGVLLCLIPLMIAGAWMWWRRPLSRLEPGERKAVTALALVTGIVCLLVALRTLS